MSDASITFDSGLLFARDRHDRLVLKPIREEKGSFEVRGLGPGPLELVGVRLNPT